MSQSRKVNILSIPPFKRKRNWNWQAEVSLLTGIYWMMGNRNLNYSDKERDEFIKKMEIELTDRK
jgi:hypothetical protein